MIRVSVIVPVYNAQAYLKRCVDSLLDQSLEELEIILVDDGSRDDSPRLCDAYAVHPRITVIHQENQGAGLARNSGLARARGEFVGFVDADDYVDLTMYRTLYETARETGADAVYIGYCRENGQGRRERRPLCGEPLHFSGKEGVKTFLLDAVGTLPGEGVDSRYGYSACRAIYRRAILADHGLTFLSERKFASEDLLFNLDFLAWAQGVEVLPQCFYHYWENTDSFTRKYQKDRFSMDKALYLEVSRRLEAMVPGTEWRLRADRLLFARARVALAGEALSYPAAQTRGEARRAMAGICRDQTMAGMLARYPGRQLPAKHRLMFFLMKAGRVGAICRVTRLRSALTRIRARAGRGAAPSGEA